VSRRTITYTEIPQTCTRTCIGTCVPYAEYDVNKGIDNVIPKAIIDATNNKVNLIVLQSYSDL